MRCTFVGLCEDPWCGGVIFVRDCPLEGSDVMSGIGDAVQFNPLFTSQDKQRPVDLCFSGQADLICMDHATLIRSPARTFVEWGRRWASLVRQPDPATEYHIL
jgi:hypothetical protein